MSYSKPKSGCINKLKLVNGKVDIPILKPNFPKQNKNHKLNYVSLKDFV